VLLAKRKGRNIYIWAVNGISGALIALIGLAFFINLKDNTDPAVILKSKKREKIFMIFCILTGILRVLNYSHLIINQTLLSNEFESEKYETWENLNIRDPLPPGAMKFSKFQVTFQNNHNPFRVRIKTPPIPFDEISQNGNRKVEEIDCSNNAQQECSEFEHPSPKILKITLFDLGSMDKTESVWIIDPQNGNTVGGSAYPFTLKFLNLKENR
jgi:hypothetical protein